MDGMQIETAAMSGREGIEEVLAGLAQALADPEETTIGESWEMPALMLSDAGAILVESRNAIDRFFSGAKREQRKLGIVGTRPEIEWFEWLTERIVSVDVRWPYLDATGRRHGDERALYVFHLGNDGRWRIRAAIARGAS